ncbi:putative terminase small subunit [Pseudomonas phage Ep4]|uniref:Terminase small subunit n=1 Tax=Pseudomonas phage Ep4 TaxID=3057492 RepID=A0AAU9ECB8_9CAUD|nr:putative terminase small subunit [Pseudomonas phage Ep4]
MSIKRKSASTGALAELHEMLAQVFIDDLRQSKEEGIPLPAANLGVIRQFLKDNEITASIDADDMANIRDEFADELAARRAANKAKLDNTLAEDDMTLLLR